MTAAGRTPNAENYSTVEYMEGADLTRVAVCLTCGSLVWNQVQHDHWHEGVRESILSDAPPTQRVQEWADRNGVTLRYPEAFGGFAGHNHRLMEIQPPGKCPGCDLIHMGQREKPEGFREPRSSE